MATISDRRKAYKKKEMREDHTDPDLATDSDSEDEWTFTELGFSVRFAPASPRGTAVTEVGQGAEVEDSVAPLSPSLSIVSNSPSPPTSRE